MNLTHAILIFCFSLVSLAVSAAPASMFPRNSVLAEGKWVKIHVDKTGVYELTDEELVSMGFDPANVYIYGRGGGMQPTQFVPLKGEAYMSDLQQVATKRYNNVTYFFAQANQKVSYLYDNDRYTEAMRFDRESNQVYSEDVAYFISDVGARKDIPVVSSGLYNDELPALTSAWSYDYHEVDTHMFSPSGRDFYGESFMNNRSQSIPYNIPNAVEGETGSLTCLFAVRSDAVSSLSVGFRGGESVKLPIPACGDTDNYRFNTKKYATLPVSSSTGNVDLTFAADGYVGFASLDYLVVGAKRTFGFAEGETQFMVYPYEYTMRDYRWLEMPRQTCDLGVWQVIDSSDVKELSYRRGEETTRVLYLSDNHRGPVVFIDYSKPQYKIKGYEQVDNQNLHALGTQTMPGMVIITLPALKDAADKLAQIHKQKEGMDVAVVLHEQVVNEFSAGVDDPMAYRALAKMLYDRDDASHRVFKNLLLFGPNVLDHRNITGMVSPIGNLICNEVPNTANAEYSYCLNDWYGMMADCTDREQDVAYGFYKEPMHIGVGVIPVSTPELADNVVNKTARFYADDSFAYWLNSFNYLADGSNDNEHQTWQENLYEQMSEYLSSAAVGTKIYNNLNSRSSAFSLFKKRLDEGSMLSFYTGHANLINIGEGMILETSIRTLNNNRLGFSAWGACDVSNFDRNLEGIGARMLSRADGGFVAVLGTSRAGYSRRNYAYLRKLQAALLCDDVDGTTPLSSPRTLGEAYALAKTAETDHGNKFVFHLLGDPAITLPLPTASVDISVNGDVYPGTEVEFIAAVMDRNGRAMNDFDGNMVLRLCAPALTATTASDQGSPSVNVTLDQTVISVSEFEVKKGWAKGTIYIPVNATGSVGSPMHLRVAAYNPQTRRGAAGVCALSVKAYDADRVVSGNIAPEVNAMYVNAPQVSEQDVVSGSFILYADVSDDLGIMAYDMNGVPSCYLSVDDRTVYYDVNNHVRMSDGGKAMHIAYPMTNLSSGSHVLTLTVSDVAGLKAQRSINVKVGGVRDVEPLQLEESGPARSSVTLISDEKSGDVRIVNTKGQCIYEGALAAGRFVWNLCDKEGVRVPTGVYEAIGVFADTDNGVAVSSPAEIIVL